MRFSSTLAIGASLALANAAVIGKRSLSGEATYYGGNVAGGMCSFSTYTLPSDILGTALSDSNWDNSANCGRCVSVTGPDGNAVTAMIVDQCPGCGTNHLDLFPDAFSDLANPTLGIIPVTWDYVTCPITSPLVLHQKEGVSVDWFSMQVVNANKGVATLEVSIDGGSTWQSTDRQTYNFFEQSSGFGVKTMDIKVTSLDGDEVIVKNVEIGAGSSVTADSNFPSSGTSSSSAVSSSASSSSAPAPSSTLVSSVASTSSGAPASVTGVAASSSSTAATATPTLSIPSASTSTYAAPSATTAVSEDACEP
ncbi:Expansin-YoaJ [Lachnellula suecica]|uniref:Expansin-YoaJ n=1 Tax=Lachnellula suecica TaxID=602035 RepID=A0A8T9CDM9_9HELO|nr:Expansin-YoaJ [Lachnellula suecica]